jgi:hypothetical protein
MLFGLPYLYITAGRIFTAFSSLTGIYRPCGVEKQALHRCHEWLLTPAKAIAGVYLSAGEPELVPIGFIQADQPSYMGNVCEYVIR